MLAKFCYGKILSVATKYNIQCLDVPVGQVKHYVWKSFADMAIQLDRLFLALIVVLLIF